MQLYVWTNAMYSNFALSISITRVVLLCIADTFRKRITFPFSIAFPLFISSTGNSLRALHCVPWRHKMAIHQTTQTPYEQQQQHPYPHTFSVFQPSLYSKIKMLTPIFFGCSVLSAYMVRLDDKEKRKIVRHTSPRANAQWQKNDVG